MAFEIFGFTFGRKKVEQPFAPIPPREDDGATVIEAGGLQGVYVDLDGTVRNDIDLIMKYREMSLHAEVDSAIDDLVNEVITSDGNGKYLDLNLDKTRLPSPIKRKIVEEFQNVLELLNFNEEAHDIFRKWYIDGRLYYHVILDDNPRQGAREYRLIDPLKIKKIREIKKKEKIGSVEVAKEVEEYYMYLPSDQSIVKRSQYLVAYPDSPNTGVRLSSDSINYVHSGLFEARTKRVIGYLHKAIKPLNQLRMVEDATVIYRWSRAPERRIFYIDVGSLPKAKAEQYIRDIMNRYRNKVVYDAATGEIRDDRKHMSMLEDFWLPRREGGRGTQIETLPGGQNLGEMADVLYFQKKLLRALGIPLTRLESNTGFNMGRASEISRDELKYSKFVERLRRKFGQLFTNFLKVQVLSKKILSEEDFEIVRKNLTYNWSTDSYFAESKDAEIMVDRMRVLREVADYSGKFFSDYWIRKNILRQTDEEIEEIDAQIELEKEQEMQELETAGGAEGAPAGGVPGAPMGRPTIPGPITPPSLGADAAAGGAEQSEKPTTFLSNKTINYDASSLL
jgi:hypothetical protein